ncbi:MAG: hypothetical protein A3F46_11255 [Legionellales bacterium RIFCSPHIGHO2_12_FULL_42_9]|nr:MAG: hypothetical protein A3F46_11255 [Legionellales bacterium RIFCSPHIGHO2_12_FULL_42_9]
MKRVTMLATAGAMSLFLIACGENNNAPKQPEVNVTAQAEPVEAPQAEKAAPEESAPNEAEAAGATSQE